jgi:hypothetical protein
MTITLTRGQILEAVLHEANNVADVYAARSCGSTHVALDVPTEHDLVMLREELFHASEAQTGYAIGKWPLVDLAHPGQPTHDVTVSIHTVGGAR